MRAKLLDPRQKLSAFAWSSYPEYLKTPHERRGWLRVDRVFGEHGIPKDSRAGRREFENRLEMRRKSEDGTESKTIVTNWFLGSDEFRKELLAQMGEAAGREHFGSEIRESEEDRADRILRQELNKIDCKEAALKEMPKGDPRKIKIARRWEREHMLHTCFTGMASPNQKSDDLTILRTDPLGASQPVVAFFLESERQIFVAGPDDAAI